MEAIADELEVIGNLWDMVKFPLSSVINAWQDLQGDTPTLAMMESRVYLCITLERMIGESLRIVPTEVVRKSVRSIINSDRYDKCRPSVLVSMIQDQIVSHFC